MVPQASSSSMFAHSVPCAEQRLQPESHAAVQQTRLPSAVARQVPAPQSASDAHVWPAERRQPSSWLLQPKVPQSVSVCHTPSTQLWCRAPEQRRPA